MGADNGGAENFYGNIDELRVFSFAAGQFNVTNLLLNRTTPFTVSSTNLVEGLGAVTDFVRLTAPLTNDLWAAGSANSWVHLTTPSGVNSNDYFVSFTLDPNTGATRVGQMTVAGNTVNITQAGTSYLAAGPVALVSSGLSSPTGVSLGPTGTVYIADKGDNAVKSWSPPNGPLVTEGITNLSSPNGLAVVKFPGVGRLPARTVIYVADSGNNEIVDGFPEATNTLTVVSTNLHSPTGVATDLSGNVYIADNLNNAVKEWNASSFSLTTLQPLHWPTSVALDSDGNLLIAQPNQGPPNTTGLIHEWNAASQTTSTLIAAGLTRPVGVAVDGADKIYIADYGDNTVKLWNPVTGVLTNLVSGLADAQGVTVDAAGNVFIANTSQNTVLELPRAFVSGATNQEPSTADADALPVVVPATASLSGVFYPTSVSSWLSIPGVTNGVIGFAFTANPSPLSRTAYISLLGQQVAVTQAGAPLTLAATNFTEGPSAGADSVVLRANPSNTSLDGRAPE